VTSRLHEVALVGLGPVGATLALAICGHGLDVVALDARRVGERTRGDRSLALSHGARLTLERVGVWDTLRGIEGALTPITEIDVSQAGGFGATRLVAADHGLEALGYVASYVALQDALDRALASSDVVISFGTDAASVEGTFTDARIATSRADAMLRARLAVIADGAGTTVAGIERTRHDYGQVALIASVWPRRPHGGVAYERFTSTGPMALLPERDHYGLVWTMPPRDAEAMLALDERAFLAALATRFGKRVDGFVRVESRRTFPLALERARPTVAARAVVIGNAAQQLHPVAGQGLNLGLRDAWELAQLILDTPRDALGLPEMLSRHARRRGVDRGAGIAFTHGLLHIFGADHAAVRWPRGIALALMESTPPLKRAFTRSMLFGLR
jgi:2-octaprenyl-6-methoxyphenol hydroxylase